MLGSSGGTGTDLSGTGTGSGRNAAASSSSSTAGAATAAASSSSTEIEVISTAYVVNLSVDTTTVGNLKIGQSATVTPTSSSSSSSSSGAGGRGGGFPGGFGAAGGGGTQTATNGTGSSANTGSRQPRRADHVARHDRLRQLRGGDISGRDLSEWNADRLPCRRECVGRDHVQELPERARGAHDAITRTNGQSTVLVSANGSTARRTVTTGITSSGEVQIISGLRAGEQIVVTVPSFRRTSGTGTTGNENSGGGAVPAGPGSSPAGVRSRAVRPAERRREHACHRARGRHQVVPVGSLAVHALQHVSMTIDQGGLVAIVGPSGSGKSTLMHIIGCLDVPTSARTS